MMSVELWQKRWSNKFVKNLIWYSVCLRGTLLSGCTNILFRCTKRERLISHSWEHLIWTNMQGWLRTIHTALFILCISTFWIMSISIWIMYVIRKQMQQIWMRSVNSMRRKSLMRAVWILQSPALAMMGILHSMNRESIYCHAHMSLKWMRQPDSRMQKHLLTVQEVFRNMRLQPVWKNIWKPKNIMSFVLAPTKESYCISCSKMKSWILNFLFPGYVCTRMLNLS